MHRLIDTGLIGAKRTASLEDKRDPVAAFGSPPLAGAGGLCRLVNRAGADVMHGKLLENANG
jgi:hypothetical protein